jgi:cytochrome P450
MILLIHPRVQATGVLPLHSREDPTVNAHPSPDWNPRAAAVLGDQRLAYDQERERCPVAYDAFLGWSLFRHDDIVGVLADPDTYANASAHRAVPNGMDPPEHTRYRHLLEAYFGPEQMTALEPRCRSIAADLAQALQGRGEVELVTQFAQPFSFQTLCVFVGWPAQTWQNLRDWTDRNQHAALYPDATTGAALAQQFAAHAADTLQTRRETAQEPGADAVTGLMAAALDATVLDDEDITSILRNWTASHGTLTAGIGIIAWHLATRPELQDRLRRQPELVGHAVEEILRADGMLVANRRITTRDVEIQGRTIPAGEHLSLNWIAANRDARTFDDPDAVQLERDQADNLLFGAGIHNCVGAPLARLEMRVAVEELLKHTTMITATGTRPPARDTYPSNGFRALPLNLN